MRKRFAVTLAAGGRWPDAQTGGIGFPFNWVGIDNRGTSPVDLGLNASVAAGDKVDIYRRISGLSSRVFNVAGPKNPDGTNPEEWPDQVYLVSPGGTTLLLDVADHPIVDFDLETAANGVMNTVCAISVGGAATQNANLGGIAGLTPVVTKAMILGLGATGATEVDATLNGTVSPSTIHIPVAVPAGVTTPITPQILDFGAGGLSGAPGGTITLTLPSFGAGNTQEEAILLGYFI